jgi:hypothetical protein
MAGKAPHRPAAFINALAEEGTREELIHYLQETWNELCELRRQQGEAVAWLVPSDETGFCRLWWRDKERAEAWLAKHPTCTLIPLYAAPPAPQAAMREAIEALEFYADPFAWKKKHDPEDVVSVPDFYSETSFGDTARAALSAQGAVPSKDRG